MNGPANLLDKKKMRKRPNLTTVATYAYLFVGVVIMFGPVVWLVLSSFKTEAEDVRFPPRLLPYRQVTVAVAGYKNPLPLFEVHLKSGKTVQLAQVSRIGLASRLVDPKNPEQLITVDIDQTKPIERVSLDLENYVQGIQGFAFARYFLNSTIVTVVATLLTLLVNSMAAFALSKYDFLGRQAIFFLMISTLMIPVSVILVPIFLVITKIGWDNNLLGVIVPGAATPTGVFLLRQYMLTIPNDPLDSARIDGASELRIYAQVVLPLARPALAVLTIFSVMWRWNDFLWPLIVLSKSRLFTLQLGLYSFQGQFTIHWNLILAMTVVTLLPISAVFGFLQRNITTGIATTGMK